MKFNKQNQVMGKWIDKKQVQSGTKCKIVSEAVEEDSNFTDQKGNTKMRVVARVQFGDGEPVKMEINRPTKNALIDAFGEDSVNWQGHELTAQIEKGQVSGKRVIFLYLVPKGYEVSENEDGYVDIVKEDYEVKTDKVGQYGEPL